MADAPNTGKHLSSQSLSVLGVPLNIRDKWILAMSCAAMLCIAFAVWKEFRGDKK